MWKKSSTSTNRKYRKIYDCNKQSKEDDVQRTETQKCLLINSFCFSHVNYNPYEE